MDKIPNDRNARVAFLEGWAARQKSRLDWEEQSRLYAEELARVVAQARQRIGKGDSLREVAVIPVVITKAPDGPVDRAAVFSDLMVGLGEYEWADPIVSECDHRYIAPQAVELARRHRPGAPWLLYMEDDVILGPDFGLLPGLLREADELFPNTGVVSFFSGSFRDPGWSIQSMAHFGWLQCTAIRNTDYLAGFRAFIDDVVTQRPGTRWEIPDAAVSAFLGIEYDSYALWCPSLVQHADVTSAFSGVPEGTRISWSYEQAYG